MYIDKIQKNLPKKKKTLRMSVMWQNTRAIHKNNLISVLANDRSQTHTQGKKKKSTGKTLLSLTKTYSMIPAL